MLTRRRDSNSMNHPLVDLILFRKSIDSQLKSRQDPTERYLMGVLPACKKNRSKSFNTLAPTDILKSYAPQMKYSFDHLRRLSEQAPGEVNTCFSCFEAAFWVWGSETMNETTDDFITLIGSLDQMGPVLDKFDKGPIRRVVNFLTLHVILKALDTIIWIPDAFCVALQCIRNNNTLDATFFDAMVMVMDRIMQSDSGDDVKSIMFRTLCSLLGENAQILGFARYPDRPEKLLQLIEPAVLQLDNDALECFSQLTWKSDNLSLETYSGLAKNIAERIRVNIFDEYKFTEDGQAVRLDMPQDQSLFEINYEFVPEFDGISEIDTPPFEILQKKVILDDLLHEEMRTVLNNVESFIRSCHPSAQQVFFERYLMVVNSHGGEDFFFVLCLHFLMFYGRYGKPENLCHVLRVFVETRVYSPNLHVFQDQPLNPLVNTLRMAVLDLINTMRPELLFELFGKIEKNTFVFTEHLLRVLLEPEKYPLRTFFNSEFERHFAISLWRLQRLNQTCASNVVKRARNAQLVFMYQLLENEETCFLLLSSSVICNQYMKLIFERGLTTTMIRMLRDALPKIPIKRKPLAIESIARFFAATIDSCATRPNDELYKTLAVDVARELVVAVHHNSSLALSFENLLPSCLNFVEKCPDKSFLKSTLHLLVLLVSEKCRFEVSGWLLCALYRAIKAVDHDEPSKETEIALLNVLRRCICGLDKPKCLIALPSCVPLLLAVFSMSQRLPAMLTFMKELCDYSDYNKRMCHDGDLDLLLLQFLCQGKEVAEMNYRGCSFLMKLARQDMLDIVIPLFAKITMVKSSSAISHYCINHVVEYSSMLFPELLEGILSQSHSFPWPTFALGSDTKQFTVTGLGPDDFAKDFTVHFKINLDNQCMGESNLNVRILSILDTKSNFSLFLNRDTLYAMYEEGCARTSVHLRKCIAGSRWLSYTIIVRFQEDRVVLSNYEEEVPLNDSLLCRFEFQSREISMDVGGVLEDTVPAAWKNRQLAVLGGLYIFPFPFAPQDVRHIVKRPWEIRDKAIFASDIIDNPATRNVYRYPRKTPCVVHRNLIEQIHLTEYVVHVHDTIRSPISLIDALANGDDCNALAGFFTMSPNAPPNYPILLLGMISQLFSRNHLTQVRFDQVKTIRSCLYYNPKFLTSELYRAVYQIFTEITCENLRVEWFESLVVDLWLWSRSDYHELEYVLHHWSHVVVPTYSEMVGKPFMHYLNQYIIFFCIGEDGTRKSALHEGGLLNDTFGVNEIRKCGNLFRLFLARVGLASWCASDVEPLFRHILNCKKKETLLNLLGLLLDVSSEAVKIPDSLGTNLVNLHHLIDKMDIDGIELTALVLHETSGEKCHIHMMALGDRLCKRKDAATSFERLIEKLPAFPNLLYCLCPLALRLGQEKITALAQKLSSITDLGRFRRFSTWFLMPLIVALHSRDANDQSQKEICMFLTRAINHDLELFDKHLSRILVSLTWLRSVSHFWDTDLLQYFIGCLDTEIQLPEKPKLAFNGIVRIFCSIFYQQYYTSHHQMLLNEFENCDISLEPRPIYFQDLRHFQAFESLPGFMNPSVLAFSLRFDEDNKWMDRESAVAVLSLEARTQFSQEDRERIKPLVDLLLYFSALPDKKNQFDASEQRLIMATADGILQENLVGYQKIYSTTLKKISDLLQKQLNQKAEILAGRNRDESEMSGNESEYMLQADYNAYGSPPEKVSSESDRKYEMDPTICTNCCPMKRKVTGRRKSVHALKKLPSGDCVFAKKCRYVRMKQGTSDVLLKLYKDFLAISLGQVTVKLVNISQITHVLPRKKNQNGIELLLSNGKSYLFEFASNHEWAPFVKELKLRCKKALVFPSPEIFMHLGSREKWVSREISNFAYIIELNMISGRSFSDRTEYPFFPVLLANLDDKTSVITTELAARANEPIVSYPYMDIREAFKNSVVPADIFFSPDSITYLPPWAESPGDVVDTLRTILESEEVSAHLHLWITAYFSQESNNTNGLLFKEKEHPARDPLGGVTPNSTHMDINLEGCAIVASAPAGKDRMTIVTSDGVIAVISLPSKDKNLELISRHGAVSFAQDTLFVTYRNQIITMSREENKATIITDGSAITSFTVFSEMELVACVDETLIFCPDACSIATMAPGSQAKVLAHTLSRITRLIADKYFKVVVVSTIDGLIHVLNLRNGALVQSTDIGGEANFMTITHNMGYIIAVTNENWCILSINGNLLKKTPLKFQVLRMFTIVHESNSFDYVFCVNKDLVISVFPAYHPEKLTSFHQSREPIELLVSGHDGKSVIIVTEGGSVTVVPNPVSLVV